MLDAGLLSKVLKRTLSRGGDFADVFVEWRKPTSVHFEGGKLEKAMSGTVQGAGIRLLFGGRTAYAFLNDLTEAALLDAASTLSKAVSQGGGERDIDLTARHPEVVFTIRKRPDSIPLEDKIGLVRAADGSARNVSGQIRQVSVIYRDSIQKVRIATSEGELVDDERVHTVGIVQVVAEKDGIIQTGYEPVGGHTGFEIFDNGTLEEAAVNAASRAVKMLSARRAPGGRMPVVISSQAGGTMIHEAIGHGLEADLAGKGLSTFSGLLGKQVASPLVTVVDDSTLPGMRGSFSFDDEGVPSKRTVLVKDGTLVSYMYDRLSAMCDCVTSTGNGRRESYRHRPIPRMTNTFIAPGSSKPEEILSATPKGLFVSKMGGGQVNTVNGEFVFDVAEGYMIDNGKIGELVRGATLTGSGPEVLMSIDMVASDLGFSIGTCGKDSQGVPVSDAMPTIRIPEMVVGGEV